MKLYDSKIVKALEVKFVGSRKKSADKVGVTSLANFEDRAKSGYQSVTDLINNRKAIKAAIVQSNATTKVDIGGKTYTVAEAIEHKSSIEYERMLLNTLKRQWADVTDNITRENVRVDNQVDKMLEAFVGIDSDKKVSEADLAAISEPYRAKNEWVIVDPLDLYKKIQSLEAEIDAFEAEVDVKLTISNSITYIEV